MLERAPSNDRQQALEPFEQEIRRPPIEKPAVVHAPAPSGAS